MTDHLEPHGRFGGIWDNLVNGKDAVAIISGLLLVDSSDNSADRLASTANVLDSIAAKTESKAVALLAAHVRTPNAATLQALLDFALVKK